MKFLTLINELIEGITIPLKSFSSFRRFTIGLFLIYMPFGIFFVLGYQKQIFMTLLGFEQTDVLPEWKDWKTLFFNGLSLVLVVLKFIVPGLIVLWLVASRLSMGANSSASVYQNLLSLYKMIASPVMIIQRPLSDATYLINKFQIALTASAFGLFIGLILLPSAIINNLLSTKQGFINSGNITQVIKDTGHYYWYALLFTGVAFHGFIIMTGKYIFLIPLTIYLSSYLFCCIWAPIVKLKLFKDD